MNQSLSSPSQFNRQNFDEWFIPLYAPADFILVRGEGSRVWDQQSREYVDFAGGIAVNALGHSHPVAVNALIDQAHKLWHLSNGISNEPVLALAQCLIQHTFAEKVFFCNSGAEANEAALKLARKVGLSQAANKNKIIAFHNAFHGRTLFTVSAGGQPKYSQDFAPLPPNIEHIAFNDVAAALAAIDAETCAVIVEPIQGEGGIIAATPEFLQALRARCDATGAVLIFDEVQTGVGRTGHLYAYMSTGITPDILTTAKALGGGFPIGAMLTTDQFSQHFKVGDHGTTYGGNPLASAVALAVFNYVRQPSVLAAVQQRSRLLIEQIQLLNQKYAVFAEIRGQGLLLGCVMAEAYAGQAKQLQQLAGEEALLALIAGPNVLRFTPALTITEQDILEGVLRLERAIQRFIQQ
ncbi:bifunctional succinylornithine transaminase/acetylornithine transaminase [Acinetobacter larvae]|uniref:Acetylornithine aminotransferase n=1 Tax=Acinetobacter larvae TaxID=1789224 RepID=A0A1B2LX40_9GAMM|nr:bifunctional succinylornithine transaminase/acetylornithine transaminase [Acinetobacter larvae]AOA57504.1 bifunctional succinylornithine transaminase/acetylornithine transaminase [Acinetobacter larvae]